MMTFRPHLRLPYVLRGWIVLVKNILIVPIRPLNRSISNIASNGVQRCFPNAAQFYVVQVEKSVDWPSFYFQFTIASNQASIQISFQGQRVPVSRDYRASPISDSAVSVHEVTFIIEYWPHSQDGP